MELTVFEGEQQVGTLRIASDGLYYDILCELTGDRKMIRRIYVGSAWKSEYLGIPDAAGRLKARLPKKRLPEGITFAVAATNPRGEYLPWRGDVDGVPIAEGFIRLSAGEIDLLLPPQEAVKLPAWAEHMQTETLCGRELLLLRLLPDGKLKEKTIDRGEKTDEENTCDIDTDCMSADDVPRDSLGGKGEQADRADL